MTRPHTPGPVEDCRHCMDSPLTDEIRRLQDQAVDEQAWRECAYRADYLTPSHHANECAYHRGEIEPVALDYDDVPPNAGSAS